MPIIAHPFYMIRHGETEANAARIMAGSLDSPLTAKGRDQAYRAQRAVKTLDVEPTAIIHSHLSRARDTAEILNEVLKLDMIEDPDLAELHAGDWEGACYSECPDLLTGWADPPNGETYDEFMTRITRAKNRHLNRYSGPALIVCHGGVFRAFGRIYGLDTKGAFQNCHLHEFQPDPAKSPFPWDVWQYDIGEKAVMRNPAGNYDVLPEAAKKSA